MILKRGAACIVWHRQLAASIPAPLISRQLISRRLYASTSHESQSIPRRRRLLVPSLLGAGVAAVGFTLYQRAKERSDENEDANRPLANVPFSTLLRSYVVYTCCSISLLVDAGPALIDWCSDTSIPGVWPCFEYVIRHTFFKQVSSDSSLI
jgi:proline dehydrogenase